MRVVIIGGGATGASCATRLRRLDENCEIIILERTDEVSIANCALPYYCSDVIEDRDNILVSNPMRFKNMFNIDVYLNTEVIDINRLEKYVLTNNNEKFYYDKLVLAQGASPIKPNFIQDFKNIFTLRTLFDADKIKDYISKNNPQKAVVIGGGFIGVEMAENLVHLGLKTTLIEMKDKILAPIDNELTLMAQNEMRKNGVELILSNGVKNINEFEIELVKGEKIQYDILILALGVKPEIELAQKIGLEVNIGIKVNDNMQTSDNDIYAGGDSVETKNFVLDNYSLALLAGPANRQGRIIADNICNIKSTYKKTQSTSVVKVFDYTVACCGGSEFLLKKENVAYKKILIFNNSHASYYPNAQMNLYELLFDNNGKILGAQGIGKDGVEKRIDVIASIMRNNGVVQDLIDSELCYAPPYSSAKDAVNILGMCADNVLRGYLKPIYLDDIKDSYLIDVRPFEMYKTGSVEGAINIPLAQLRAKLNQIPKDKKIVVFCETGYTSYLASRILLQSGFCEVYSMMAGMKLYREMFYDFNNKKESFA